MNEIWSHKIHTMFKKKPKNEEELFLDIVSMITFNRYNDKLSAIYKELGVDKFSRLISLLSSETIDFPSREDWKDSMLTAVCFYYKEIKGMKWEEIKRILPFKRVNSIKIGKRINSLESDMVKEIFQSFEKIEESGGSLDEYTEYCR